MSKNEPCPHAAPHMYCDGCKVSPCPIGLDGSKPKVKPLKAHTMTLEELQDETLSLIGKVKRQLYRQPWKGGMSDEEFIDQVLDRLTHRIKQDKAVLAAMEGK